MKIAIVPDVHLNKAVYKGVMDRDNSLIPFRSVDFMKAFKYVVDKCVNELKPDLFVIPGDIYDNWEPSNKVRGFLSSQLRKLTEAKIPIIILIGNHDISRKDHSLRDIQELGLKSIRIVDMPMIVTYKDTQLFLFPYSLDVEQKKKTIKEDFLDFVKEISAKKNEKPSIFFGHFGVRGASINQYSGDSDDDDDDDIFTDTTTTHVKEYKNRNPNDIDCDDLDSIGAEYVILGDYHKHQILDTKKCIAMYPGSIEKTSFAEVNQKKGFILYDSESTPQNKMGKCSFIEYPNCRPMLELKGNFADVKDAFKKIDCSKYQDAIVKLRFTGTPSELIDFSAGMEALKKEIREKINPIHIYFINKSKDEKQEEEATKLEQDIMENGQLSNDDVKEVVKEVIRERVKDEKEMALTFDLADEIYQETAGK
jgi:exonuclease SbcD